MVARGVAHLAGGLAAALRTAHGTAPATGVPARQPVRVSSAPDPRMYGRQVYTMAIQIPTHSYSGSWLVWFASREPDIGNPNVDMHAALVPLHMVSARYINSAVDDRVEGKVRLWAVIGKDGHVGDISMLQHWMSAGPQRPGGLASGCSAGGAQRRGRGRDAVFEIPFTLPPNHNDDAQHLLIDADDTLWENNIYFERAFDEFVAYLDHSAMSPGEVGRCWTRSKRPMPGSTATVRSTLRAISASAMNTWRSATCARKICARDGFCGAHSGVPHGDDCGAFRDVGVPLRPPRSDNLHESNPEEQKLKIDRSGLGRFFRHAAIVKEKDTRRTCGW